MTNAEAATRAAARLIGRDITGMTWDDNVLAMRNTDGFSVFSPITDPCDAFMVEASLTMNVRCEFRDGRVAMYASSPKDGMQDLGYMATARADLLDDIVRVRMLVVTTFAHLLAIAEDSDA
jgi:hypothetical protein